MSELTDAMRRLLHSAVPAKPDPPYETPPAMVLVQRADLRIVLGLVKQLKNLTPADGCVLCRHKDREHSAGGCQSCGDIGRRCDGFLPIAEVPFDIGVTGG